VTREVDPRAAALQAALDRLEAGTAVGDVLGAPTEFQEELGPMLAAAALLTARGPEPADGFVEDLAGRLRGIAAVPPGAAPESARQGTGPKGVRGTHDARGGTVGSGGSGRKSRDWVRALVRPGRRQPLVLRVGMGVAAVALALGVLTVAAAAASRPGDPLFGLRLRLEERGWLPEEPTPVQPAGIAPSPPASPTPTTPTTDLAGQTPSPRADGGAGSRRAKASASATATVTPTRTATPTATATPTVTVTPTATPPPTGDAGDEEEGSSGGGGNAPGPTTVVDPDPPEPPPPDPYPGP
jgi:hypothetical protein